MNKLELRSMTLIKLNDQTSELVKNIESKDIPQWMKDKTIQGIFKLHNEFRDKLIQEIEELKIGRSFGAV